ncbi:MAG: YaiO family outer membrane beta-barrel protein [Rhodothermia bacterium]|nr:YaiO family outer membrane beta-barrel protein [Rhodothermia bacterium]
MTWIRPLISMWPTAIAAGLLFVTTNAHADNGLRGITSQSGQPQSSIRNNDSQTQPDASEAASAGLRWFATASHGFHRFSNDRPTWQAGIVTFGAKSSKGRASFLEMGWLSRHEQDDIFGAINHYQPVGGRAYANLRVSLAPGADVSPRNDVYAEVFRSLPRALEVSGGYRFARYRDATLHTPSVGIAKYVRNWYFRLKSSVTPIDGSVGFAAIATVRSYGQTSEEFIGFTVAAGREIVGLPGGTVLARSPFVASVYGQRFLTSNAGLRLSVDVVRDGDLSRSGISAGLIARW